MQHVQVIFVNCMLQNVKAKEPAEGGIIILALQTVCIRYSTYLLLWMFNLLLHLLPPGGQSGLQFGAGEGVGQH